LSLQDRYVKQNNHGLLVAVRLKNNIKILLNVRLNTITLTHI